MRSARTRPSSAPATPPVAARSAHGSRIASPWSALPARWMTASNRPAQRLGQRAERVGHGHGDTPGGSGRDWRESAVTAQSRGAGGDHVTADEPAGARDEDAHPRCLGGSIVRLDQGNVASCHAMVRRTPSSRSTSAT